MNTFIQHGLIKSDIKDLFYIWSQTLNGSVSKKWNTKYWFEILAGRFETRRTNEFKQNRHRHHISYLFIILLPRTVILTTRHLHLHLADAFIQSDLQWIHAIHIFFSMYSTVHSVQDKHLLSISAGLLLILKSSGLIFNTVNNRMKWERR